MPSPAAALIRVHTGPDDRRAGRTSRKVGQNQFQSAPSVVTAVWQSLSCEEQGSLGFVVCAAANVGLCGAEWTSVASEPGRIGAGVSTTPEN